MKHRAAWLAALVLVISCGPKAPPSLPSGQVAYPSDGTKELNRLELESRPSLTVISREGDPHGAVAFALAHPHGSVASAAVAALLEARLPADARVSANHLGVLVSFRVARPEDVKTAVDEVTRALSKEVEVTDARALRQARERIQDLRRWQTEGRAAVAACTGELGLEPGSSPPSLSVSRLNEWREAVWSHSTTGIAAVGTEDLGRSAVQALQSGPKWPPGPEPRPTLPTGSVSSTATTAGEVSTLRLALTVAHPAAALAAARQVARPQSRLARRVGPLLGWQLKGVTATVHLAGACLRADLSTRSQPTAEQVANVARLMEAELRRAVGRKRHQGWEQSRAALNAADPLTAAVAAAWNLHARELKSEAAGVRFLSFEEPARGPDTVDADELAQALEEEKEPKELEHVVSVERGQGELWLLLASPCGTSAETPQQAGVRALMLQTLAAQRSGASVSINPWISADGVGLLAHSPPLNPSETPAQHARRVADALGATLTATRMTARSLERARHELLERLHAGTSAGYWTALNAASGGVPSRLEPRGIPNSIAELGLHDLRAERQLWLQEPLRLASLSPHSQAQAEIAAHELSDWLAPVRRDSRKCASLPVSSPEGTHLELQTRDEDAGLRAWVAVPISAQGLRSRAAHAMALLLNRQDGWLDQALRAPALAASAQASVLGGATGGVLLVEVRALEEKLDDALAQLRGLLQRLAEGAVTRADARLAQGWLARQNQRLSLDPRYRLVKLWHQNKATAPNLQELRRFAKQLGLEHHIVVEARPRAQE